MQGGTLHLNLGEEPESLDPRSARTLRDLTLSKQLFEGLFRLDSSGEPKPAIATSYALSEDQRTYTFYLREAFWSDGTPITAEDFIYSWKKVLSPDFVSDFAHMLFPIENAEKVKCGELPVDAVGIWAKDSHTLRVTLGRPTPYFLELLAFPTFFAVKAGSDEIDSAWASTRRQKLIKKRFITSGPFSLAHWKNRDELLFKKNENYWDKEAVALAALSFSTVGDVATENYLFEKGLLDWQGLPLSHNLTPELIEDYRKKGKLYCYPVTGTLWTTFNCRDPIFGHAKIRKAFAIVLSRKEIIEHILSGNQAPATGILPPSMQIKRSPFFSDGDVQTGTKIFEEFLKESGLTREKVKVTLTTKPQERMLKIAQLAKEIWQECFEIDIALESIEGTAYNDKVRLGDFQVAFGQWVADYADPISFLEIFTSPNILNTSGWENIEFTKILEMARIEKDPVQRSLLLLKAERLVIDDMVVAPLYHYSFDYLLNPSLHGVIFSPHGTLDFKCAYKDESRT